MFRKSIIRKTLGAILGFAVTGGALLSASRADACGKELILPDAPAPAPVPAPAVVVEAPARPVAPAERPVVQIAILLDTSGSMDGLISQAKTQLWKIVNEFATAKRKGVAPRLEVALYEYGKSSIAASEGHLRMLVPLASDLDKVSEELFKLQTNGGDEYCGRVIKAAVEGLAWSDRKDALRMIFVCGNEPFTQGDVDYKAACKAAIEKGIMVNTIFCGANSEGVATGWKDGADRADGRFFSIDQDQQIAMVVEAPQDKKIAELAAKLNGTYVAFNKAGQAGKDRQVQEDANAAGVNAQVFAARNGAKATAQYHCAWDLCDAWKANTVKIEDIKDEDLPEVLRKLDMAGRKKWVEDKLKEREAIQAEMRGLTGERDKYVAEELKKRATEKGAKKADTLDEAVGKAIREQAGKKDYKFD